MSANTNANAKSKAKSARQIPIYLFTGFLEAGKTKFIQETLEDPRFSDGEPTLVLVCEEGLEEYAPKKCPNAGSIRFKNVESLDELSPAFFSGLEAEISFNRVIVEYNGMWLVDEFYKRLPENWQVYQEMLFFDAGSFLNYNANMRSLIVDKLTGCELAVFNRCPKNVDKMQLHKIVRATNRRCDIAYEYVDGSVDYDDIEDPLPFDVNAPVIEIHDEDYAVWYRDMTEKFAEYDGKTVRFKATIRHVPREKNLLVAGRQVMTCCVEDIRFAGFLCETDAAETLSDGDWVMLTAKIHVKYHKVYKRKGPVLAASTISPCDAPEEAVATFY